MIVLILANNAGSLTLELPSPPVTTTTVEGATDVQTLDNNVSTYFTTNKRQWLYQRDSMSESAFNELKAIYDAQWTEFRYPLLSIAHYGISDVPVRMYLESRNAIDNCGTVEDVSVTFRETRQLA